MREFFYPQMDLERDLSDSQRCAVTHGEGPLLVLAGAGSGKTRVVTCRIAHLVAATGVAPWRIMAVTFTNKAAGEMRARVREMLGPQAADVWLGTFHATCARLLRMHPGPAGLSRDFAIIDEDDQRTLAGQVLRDLGIVPEVLSAKDLRIRIDRAKQDGLGPDDLPAGRPWAPPVAEAYAEYERRLRASNAVDFGDLLVMAVRMLERDAEVREKLRDRFLHLLVDEFQDTNAIQYRLLRLLVNERRNLCVVGDDDQSIYGWRGARVRNILGFEREFPGAVVVRLEQNYRSASHILESAAAVIERNKARHAKKLWTANAAGEPVRVIAAGDEREEAWEVARLVGELRARGRPLRSAAVFYRINAQSRVIEEAMRARGLPYVVVGGFRFYERAEVKSLLAYLRLLANPADDLSFARIVNVPPRGVGKVTFERLAEHARAAGIPLAAAAATVADVAGIATAAACGLADLAASLERWRAGAVEGPAAVARLVFEESGYAEALRKDRGLDAESRLQNVHELIGSIGEYEREAETPTLTGYLEQVSLQSAADEADTSADRIALMTVHSAKGLEFADVFVVGLEETVFPYQPWAVVDEEREHERERVEEERRLCYVAMTRARERLYLFHAVRRRLFGGAPRCNPPSRYLGDLPDRCVQTAALPGAESQVELAAGRPPQARPAASRSVRPAPVHCTG
ncbi:MAG: UvrD-helicase domain-containing protein, partial [Myxococcota bacterium]|nr:UvrD-helicase domain-containing protein [Myxococcota bacterium]